MRRLIFSMVAAVFAAAALFVTRHGVQVVYAVLTFEGEGSLGHVGMYIAAGLFPALALICGALCHLAWRAARRS